MIALGLLACGPGDEPSGDAPIPEPTEPTGPCEPVAEIPGNGIDEACNGWDDEVGLGVAIRSAAAVTWIGGKDDALGWDLDGGVDGEGQTWLLAAAPTAAMWYGRGQLLGDRAPTDGIWDASVVQEVSESRPFEAVGVAAWVTPFVLHMPSFIVVYPVATGIDYEDDAWLYQNSGSSDIEIAPDLTGDGVEDLLDGWEGLRVYAGPPPAGEWGDPWLHVTATPESQNFAYQVGEVGDLTGDGLPELTAYGEDDDIGGLAWLIPGDLVGVVAVEDVGIRVEGEYPEGQAVTRSLWATPTAMARWTS